MLPSPQVMPKHIYVYFFAPSQASSTTINLLRLPQALVSAQRVRTDTARRRGPRPRPPRLPQGASRVRNTIIPAVFSLTSSVSSRALVLHGSGND